MNEDKRLSEELWQGIADVYGLGKADDAPPRAVTGGLKHGLYHARTNQGEYAVKILNGRSLREKGSLARFHQAERIARAAALGGLPAVLAFPGPDGPVQKVEAATGLLTVMVFPWLSGVTLSPAPAPPAAAHQIGGLLGRLHSLAQADDQLEPPASPRFPAAHWATLARLGQQEDAPWADMVADALPELVTWSANAQEAQARLGNGWRTSHRDMDQKNVLWSEPDTPWLLDWEEAGAMHPALEVMGTALNWAGQAVGSPAEEPFLAFLDGYRSAPILSHSAVNHPTGNHPAVDRAALRSAAVAVLDKWLIWLNFNLMRSLPASGAGPEEQAMAFGAAEHSLATLRVLDAETGATPDLVRYAVTWCDMLPRE